MKIFKRILALAAVVIMLAASIVPAAAITPYSTYTYDIDGTYMESPHAYVPDSVIDSARLKLATPFASPEDFIVADYVDENGKALETLICISDGGANKRVVITNGQFEVVGVIKNFNNEWGVPDTISDPHGLSMAGNKLYVCDTSGNRILVFDVSRTLGEDGKYDYSFDFEKTLGEPEGDVFAEGTVYKPVAVAASTSGKIYVVSSTSYQGIIAMNDRGEFSAFLGAQTSELSIWEMIWRNFQTAEQKAKDTKNVSTEYNNINIDKEGFVYATTSSIDENSQLNAILTKSKSGEYAPVKKLNSAGTDVMMRTGFYPPAGEVNVNSAPTANTTITGPSKIVDVALGPDGVWSIIDEKRQKIYTYDEEGRLLHIFGDQGDQLGNIQTITAIDYYGDDILVLDKTNKNITIYNRTSYGDLLAEAIRNQRNRLYDKAAEDWRNILQRNSNFDMSYVGIGKSYYREGRFQEAMDMYKYAYDVTNYSDAYHELRKEAISQGIILIPIVLIVVCMLVSRFMKYAAKKNVEGQSSTVKRTLWREFLYGFYVMFHPFDGFWDIKHEKRASVKGASLILGINIVAFIYQSMGQGYIVDPAQEGSNFILTALSILLPVGLWIIANWCLTTLFDGEGSISDIYISTCYALFPLPAFVVLTTFFSNFVTADEVSIINLCMGIAYFWVGFLIFFGMMTIHDYSLGKNVLTTIGSIVGMAFIMFVAVLFSSLVGKIVSFIYNIALELSYRV